MMKILAVVWDLNILMLARFFSHSELYRCKSGFSDKEFSENRLVRKPQYIGNFFHVVVGAFQQFAGVGTKQFRNVETDRMSRNIFHNTGEIGSRDVQSVSIKISLNANCSFIR